MADTSNTGVRYSDEEHETALQVWAFLADRSPRKTSDILQEKYDIAVPAKRISEWARNREWHTKAQALYRAQAPDLFDQTKFTLTAAGPDAARYLSDVTRKNPDGTYVVAEPDRVRVQAALGVLDRLGFVPMTRKDGGQQSPVVALPTSSSDADDLASLSTDDLRAIAAGKIDADDLTTAAPPSTEPYR